MTTKEQDKLIRDQREANEAMVGATIRAQELTEEAEAARERAEQSERELRALAEFRELFVGIVGHDLRSPLASIIMCAGYLLGRGRLDEQDERTVNRIVDSAQRMTRMIAQLLDLTRARLGGGLPLETRPADLRDVCRTIVGEFEPGIIQFESEGEMTGIWDPDRLAQVLSNITRNAIEHAAPETAIVIKAHAEAAEVVVEITNQGESIPEAMLPFIFDPFRRARQHEKSKTGNLGLGLFIAREIVRAHGGALDAGSRNGMTTFTMRLPRHR